MDVTIFIPTLNRSKYILRILEYYKKSSFSGQILIFDSSNEKEKKLNIKYINSYSNNLNIDYVWDIGWSFELFKKYKKYFKKKNCIFSGDDDYISSEGLTKAIYFLDLKKNKKIIAASGKAVVMQVIGKYFNNIITSTEYKLTSAIEKNNLDRLDNFFTNYSVPIYSVIRTNIFKKVLKYTLSKKNRKKCDFRSINSEILPCSLLVAQGQILKIDAPLVIRTTGHPRVANNLIGVEKNKSFKKSTLYLIKSLAYVLKNKHKKLDLNKKLNIFMKKYIQFYKLRSNKFKFRIKLNNLNLKKLKNYLFFLIIFFSGNARKSANLYCLLYGYSYFSKDVIIINEIIKKIKIK